MNKRIVGAFYVAVFSIFFFSCNGDENGPGKTEEEIATESLAGSSGNQTWTVANGGAVSKDGTSETSNFSNFELRFISNNTGKSYTTSGGDPLFDPNGNWTFVGENFDKIQLSGNQPAANSEISYTRNQDNLRLEFSISAPANNRVNALAGFYVFELKLKN